MPTDLLVQRSMIRFHPRHHDAGSSSTPNSTEVGEFPLRVRYGPSPVSGCRTGVARRESSVGLTQCAIARFRRSFATLATPVQHPLILLCQLVQG